MTGTAQLDTAVTELLDPAHGILIGGQWRSGGKGLFAVENPATEEQITRISNGSLEDASAAVDAAADQLGQWSQTAPQVRSELIRRVGELMMRDSEQLADLISTENGKSLADARSEVAYAADFFRWYAAEAVRTDGNYGTAPSGGVRTIVMHQPVGVAALVTPWNFPAAMATRKIAPALAAGCTLVLKPASQTPLTAVAIARLTLEAGIPPGVVNVVPSANASEIVTTWLQDPRVRKLSFTGSTDVGRSLLSQAAERVVNTSMELGGNAPFVVTASADLDAAVAGAMIAKFRNGGQACTAANTFYVHADVVNEFTSLFATAVTGLRVGPAHNGSDIGPLISAKALANVRSLVDDAVEAGASVVHRSTVQQMSGHFYPPTILTGIPPNSPLATEEIFGPVAPIVTWHDTDELVATVNETVYGLAAYAYGELEEVLRLAERVDAGMVGINRGLVSDPSAPFGGLKQSGLGREGARAGLEEYLETRYLSVGWN